MHIFNNVALYFYHSFHSLLRHKQIVMVRHPFLRVVSAFHDKMSPDQKKPLSSKSRKDRYLSKKAEKTAIYLPLSRKIEAAYRPMRSDPAH